MRHYYIKGYSYDIWFELEFDVRERFQIQIIHTVIKVPATQEQILSPFIK